MICKVCGGHAFMTISHYRFGWVHETVCGVCYDWFSMIIVCHYINHPTYL